MIYQPFNFSFPQDSQELIRSLNKFGQISPIIISRIEGNLSIIDGLKRFTILNRLGINPIIYELDAMVLAYALDVYLEINLFSRKFNTIEKIHISRFIIQHNVTIKKELISRAELGDIERNSLLYDFIEQLNDSEKTLIVKRQLTPILVERLSKTGIINTKKILGLINKRLTHQQAREIITDLFMLYMQGKDIEKMISKISEMNFEEIRKEIKQYKNPILTRMEDDLNKFTEQFKSIIIYPPENFEGGRYRCEASFKNEEDLNKIIQDIMSLKEEWKRNPISK